MPIRLILGIVGLLIFSPILAASDLASLSNSVVLIRTVKQGWDYTTPWKQRSISQVSGSGLIIEGNRILTNAHNISNARYIEVKKQYQAKQYPASVAFVGHDCDLAVLTVDDPEFFQDTVPLELGPIPKVNSTVSTCGFPVGGTHISITAGIVSRIQMDTYSHPGADSHLVIQTDAAINPGNSGGPVIQDGKVVGIAFQGLRQADNIGYMIPTTVIRHFLKDIEDGRYDHFGSLGFSFFTGLHSEPYRQYLQLPQGQQGVVVLKTQMNSSAAAVFQPQDVITRFDDYDIDNDGMIHIYGLRLHMSEAIESKQIGDSINVTFYRHGKKIQQDVPVALNRPVIEYSRQFDVAPRYTVYAGLVFVSLSRNFLETWGTDWYMNIPHPLRYLLSFADNLNHNPNRKEYVILSEIMPYPVNDYADDFLNQPLDSVNGVTILSLDDVMSAFENNKNKYHVIRFWNQDKPLVMDAQAAQKSQPEILKQYQIPAAERLENTP